MLDLRFTRSSIDYAIKTALDFQSIAESDQTFLLSLRDLPDDEPVSVNHEWEPDAGQIVIDDVDDLPKLYDILGGMTGLFYKADSIAAIAYHERKHSLAARRLGAKRSVFGLELARCAVTLQTPDGVDLQKAFCAPLAFNTSKLGLALVKAYPKDCVESGDEAAVKLMGYSSVQQVGDKALKLIRGGAELPLPLSYKPR